MDIKKINLSKKRVFVRADLNVPLKQKQITHDYRLHAVLPTIDYILSQGSKIVLATHIGRPHAQEQKNFFDENLSTKILIPWFESQGYKIEYEIDLQEAIEKSHQDFDKILLLENLRFFNGEQETNDEFAELLAQCADVYINDAFGVLHRHDTSITLLPEHFAQNCRALGFLVEKELRELSKLKEAPKQPFVIVIGGKKAETKTKLLEHFLEQPAHKRVNTILVGGTIAQSISREFLEKAKAYDVKVMLPVDEISEGGNMVDIGPQTIELFKKEISLAKTIFANGTMGIFENEAHSQGSKAILEAIANSDAYSIIGGGDTVFATHLFNLEKQINFLSTGGGATLAYLANQSMPGIKW